MNRSESDHVTGQKRASRYFTIDLILEFWRYADFSVVITAGARIRCFDLPSDRVARRLYLALAGAVGKFLIAAG